MDFERDNNPSDEEDWTEDLTQPEQPEPRGITHEDLQQQPTSTETPSESASVPTPPPSRHRPWSVLVHLLNLVMLGFSVAIVYVYFMQDVDSAVRDVLAVAAGVLFAILFLAMLISILLKSPFSIMGAKTHEEMISRYGPTAKSKPIIAINVDEPFVQYHATTVKITVRNISSSLGLRVRFHSMDHISPSSIDLPLAPGETEAIEIQLVPIAVGEREISIEFADLFDADGNLIPKFEANTLAVERFRYIAREPAFGGITASQVRILKTVVSVATALVVGSGFILAFFGDALGGFDQIIKTYMPMLVILQVPVFYLYFALMNRLPS
ncbi:MAG: hypothetical protein K9W43_12200 [Candidatus Thorarchaeota archaeon]|nr:hypothetical protein [Candidatus Thorarchaeota archaeon]